MNSSDDEQKQASVGENKSPKELLKISPCSFFFFSFNVESWKDKVPEPPVPGHANDHVERFLCGPIKGHRRDLYNNMCSLFTRCGHARTVGGAPRRRRTEKRVWDTAAPQLHDKQLVNYLPRIGTKTR